MFSSEICQQCLCHRIIDDRIENSIKGRRIQHPHPQTTYVPQARLGVENGGGRRVRQGSTGPAPHMWSVGAGAEFVIPLYSFQFCHL